MKKIIFIVVIFFSCNKDSQKITAPENLISQEKMIDVIYEMTLISVSKGVNRRVLDYNGVVPEKYIFNKYNIDSLQFVVSNEYYSKDLEIYLSIYEEVLNKLQLNRELIIDSIENYKKDRAKRSQEINLESTKNNKLTKPNLSSNLNSNILEN